MMMEFIKRATTKARFCKDPVNRHDGGNTSINSGGCNHYKKTGSWGYLTISSPFWEIFMLILWMLNAQEDESAILRH